MIVESKTKEEVSKIKEEGKNKNKGSNINKDYKEVKETEESDDKGFFDVPSNKPREFNENDFESDYSENNKEVKKTKHRQDKELNEINENQAKEDEDIDKLLLEDSPKITNEKKSATKDRLGENMNGKSLYVIINTKYYISLILISLCLVTTGEFFKTSMINKDKKMTEKDIEKERERKYDTNLIEEGGESFEDADLSQEIAKIEQSLVKK